MTDDVIKHHRIWKPLEWLFAGFLATIIIEKIIESYYMVFGSTN